MCSFSPQCWGCAQLTHWLWFPSPHWHPPFWQHAQSVLLLFRSNMHLQPLWERVHPSTLLLRSLKLTTINQREYATSIQTDGCFLWIKSAILKIYILPFSDKWNLNNRHYRLISLICKLHFNWFFSSMMLPFPQLWGYPHCTHWCLSFPPHWHPPSSQQAQSLLRGLW